MITNNFSMKRVIILISVFISVSCLTMAQTERSGRQKISINSGWQFAKGDSASVVNPNKRTLNWQTVELPHTWNDKDVLADEKRGYYQGIGWYKRWFNLVPKANKRYFLQFEGANQVTEVYVNGKFAGKHIGGYSAFNIDLTLHLNSSGEQYVAVKVDNSFNENIPPLSADFTFFGGIYRPVHLITTGDKHFSMSDYGGPGVYISTPKVTKTRADVSIDYYLKNDTKKSSKLQLKTLIRDKKAQVLTEKLTSISLPALSDTFITVPIKNIRNFDLWSPDNPNVYYVENTLMESGIVLDNITQPMGFRWFSFDPSNGFFINGENLKLMGANRHQDRVPFGNALTNDMHRQDMQILKDMGTNFLRNAHYPQVNEILRNADEMGFVVWEETPLVNEVTISEEHTENAKLMVKEMIKQHYNHPSIFIWAYMNEIYWAHRFKPEEELPARNAYTLELAQELENLVREMDPYRYTSIAMHNYPLYDESGIGSIPMIAGWNLYHGWYYDEHNDFGKFMDEQRAKYPERIHIISEYGAGSDMRLYSEKPDKFDFTVEEQLKFTQSLMTQILERPYIAGATLWNLIDFSSERRVDATPHLNNKGLVTADRKPKDVYYLVQALLSKEPISVLGYPFRNRWVHAAENPADTLVPVNMYAFSNEKSLSLYVNNTLWENKEVINGMAEWNLLLPAGNHLLSLKPNNFNSAKQIQTELIPYGLKKENLDIAVNIGCDYAFIDDRTDLYWLPEKEYSPGSFGIIGGKQLYISNKVGTKEDILSVHEEDPLYQTMRVNPSEFKADVPDGIYEIELLMVDYVRRYRRFADVDKEIRYEPGKRVFGISVNDKFVTKELDLGGTYGLNVPNRLRFTHRASNGEGISIKFHPVKGEPVLSGVRIRKVRY